MLPLANLWQQVRQGRMLGMSDLSSTAFNTPSAERQRGFAPALDTL